MADVINLDPTAMTQENQERLQKILKNQSKQSKKKMSQGQKLKYKRTIEYIKNKLGQKRKKPLSKDQISNPTNFKEVKTGMLNTPEYITTDLSANDKSTVKKNSNISSSRNNSKTRNAKMRNTNLNLYYQNWEAIQKMYNLPDPEPPKKPKPDIDIDTEPMFPPGLGVEPIYQNVDVLERHRGKSKKVSRRPGLNTIKESSNEPPPIPRNRPPRKSSSIVTKKRPRPVPKVPPKRQSVPKKPTRKAPKPPTSRSTKGSQSKIPRRKVSSKSRIPAFKYKAKGRRKKGLKKKKTL